jgi:hypothetical protein
LHISITGARACKNITLGEVQQAAYWFLSKLMSKRSLNSLSLSIRFIDFPPKYWTGCAHYQIIEDSGRPNDYTVWIKPNLSKRLTLQTLAHELVHVKQWFKRERKDCDFEIVKFKKKKYNEGKMAYRNMPWEKEAYAREDRLYKGYMKHLKELKSR